MQRGKARKFESSCPVACSDLSVQGLGSEIDIGLTLLNSECKSIPGSEQVPVMDGYMMPRVRTHHVLIHILILTAS